MMELTGKCKEDFDTYYLSEFGDEDDLHQFKRKLHNSEKYGVFVDFADSVGYSLNIGQSLYNEKRMAYIHVNDSSRMIKIGIYTTRPEARTASIEKFNEIHNQRHG